MKRSDPRMKKPYTMVGKMRIDTLKYRTRGVYDSIIGRPVYVSGPRAKHCIDLATKQELPLYIATYHLIRPANAQDEMTRSQWCGLHSTRDEI